MKVRKKIGLAKKLLGLFLVVVIIILVVNRQLVSDFVRGSFYSPSADMIEVRKKLNLTNKGEMIFNASWPELNDEEKFNINCLSYNEAEAILGCYKGQKIYVYNISDAELDGIVELATAHELLHAVYERMAIDDKNRMKTLLEKFYEENQGILKEEIEFYDGGERLEELYVRVGTEIRNLPEILEAHYAEIFKDRSRIVSYYESYIGVFRRLEEESNKLEVDMRALKERIDVLSSEYEIEAKQLNKEIYIFNNCAETANCFSDNNEFNLERSKLIIKQANLKDIYKRIDDLINKYNSDVEEFNNNVVRHKTLQNIINSHVVVEGI